MGMGGENALGARESKGRLVECASGSGSGPGSFQVRIGSVKYMGG